MENYKISHASPGQFSEMLSRPIQINSEWPHHQCAQTIHLILIKSMAQTHKIRRQNLPFPPLQGEYFFNVFAHKSSQNCFK